MVRRYFGTDGIRGRANKVITPELALKVGQAAGLIFKNGEHRHRVLIGKDTRLSGYMIETALVAGFTSVGMDVLLTGPIPTPAVGMLARSMRADLGVMISASHNPFDDNGIKLFGPDGFKLSDEVESEIEALLDSDLGKQSGQERRSRPRQAHRRRAGPLHRIRQAHAAEGDRSVDGLRVVIDCANGAAYKVAPGALWELGADVIAIGVDPDGININKECGSTDLAAISQQGARDARRYRHRARRRRRPRHDRGRARPCGGRRPVARRHRRKLEGRRPAAAPGRGRHRDVQSRPRAPSRRPRPRTGAHAGRRPLRARAHARARLQCRRRAVRPHYSFRLHHHRRRLRRRLAGACGGQARQQAGVGALPPLRAAAAGAQERALPERQAAGERATCAPPSPAPRRSSAAAAA